MNTLMKKIKVNLTDNANYQMLLTGVRLNSPSHICNHVNAKELQPLKSVATGPHVAINRYTNGNQEAHKHRSGTWCIRSCPRYITKNDLVCIFSKFQGCPCV